MSDPADKPSADFLTESEVADRYRGAVSPGTLRNWRALGRGPAFMKVGRSVLYPLAALEAWEQTNTRGKPRRGDA